MKKLIAAVVAALTIAPATTDAHFYAGCKKRPCKRHVVKPFNSLLKSIHRCESRGNWFVDDYHDGGLQFLPSTWRATGSRYALAHHAPILEQKYRAVVWASKIGWAWRSSAGWPNCA